MVKTFAHVMGQNTVVERVSSSPGGLGEVVKSYINAEGWCC